MTTYPDDSLLLLSGIQHFAFCERQWALIHVEQQWQENVRTFEGRNMHERADDPFFTEARGPVLISRAVPIVSRQLGLYGIADVVEFHKVDQTKEAGVLLQNRSGIWKPHPVEYKYGQPKDDERDMVQLCAQAICLEEMLGVSIETGDLYYGRIRRRLSVAFDDKLRQHVTDLANRMHEMFQKGITPQPQLKPACDNCSLVEICLPKLKGKTNVVDGYLKKAMVDNTGQN